MHLLHGAYTHQFQTSARPVAGRGNTTSRPKFGTAQATPISHPDQFTPSPRRLAVKTELESLKAWDQKTHPDAPVFLRLNIDTIVNQLPQRPTDAYLIAVAGGSGSGKSTICHTLKRALPNQVNQISLDNYFKNVQHIKQDMGIQRYLRDYLRDTPDNLHLGLATEHLARLKSGEPTEIPNAYADMTTANRVESKPFILAEGLLALQHQPIRELANLKLFLDVTPDIRAKRYYQRILSKERSGYGDALDSIRLSNVEKCHQQFVEPSKDQADVVINAGLEPPIIEEALLRLCKIIQDYAQP